jgi:hypothetical protein
MSVHKVSTKVVFFSDEAEYMRWKQSKHQEDSDRLTSNYSISEDNSKGTSPKA